MYKYYLKDHFCSGSVSKIFLNVAQPEFKIQYTVLDLLRVEFLQTATAVCVPPPQVAEH